ncbi:winged helix-turn-helix transcriptional regulator [Parabacteroides massiliensis]|uniref:winged helix-turn-helix transcriptional regulator n=1 Tax=Parabacteroides massiliensis TaxID=1750560 RepID=UPI00373FD58A
MSETGSIRFNQLGKLIPDISTKVLSNTLRTLEADDLVKRTVFPEVPIRVEYELTEIGKSLVPIIVSLTEWAQKNMKSIMMHRKKSATVP